MADEIVIRGAREHNLKDVSVTLPRNRLICITGLSGSGKSSLAFDTIYAEGQRRYVESLSAYARQFLGQMEKPDVDTIEGLSPAISIDQKTTSKNPRSTVGTVTEVYDYLRLLFARVGHPHCPVCGEPIAAQSIEQILDSVELHEEGTRLMVLAPLVRMRKGEFGKLFEEVRRDGFTRVVVDGELRNLNDEDIVLDKKFKHDIDVVIDRVSMKAGVRRRLADSVETALRLADGLVVVRTAPKEGEGEPEERTYSERFACPKGHVSIPELEPRIFSFNNPHGACTQCTGLGYTREVDPDLIVADVDISIGDGALAPGTVSGGYYQNLITAICEHWGIPTNVPWRELEGWMQDVFLWGTPEGERVPVTYRNRRGRTRTYRMKFEGFVAHFQRRYHDTESEMVRDGIERFMFDSPCKACKGDRLRPESLAVTVGGTNIAEVSSYDVATAVAWLNDLELSENEMLIARRIVREIQERLQFLVDVGVGYLGMGRAARSLSGGEAQRIRLATQIGSSLVGVLYILDEPSIGLHQRDNGKLLGTLTRLRDLGNTVIVVEHDEETMRECDFLVDIGPGAGEHGGEIVAQGTAAQVAKNRKSITGDFLSGRRSISVPERITEDLGWLTVRGAAENNLQDVDVSIPVGRMTCVTGVSGSGKSTLVNEIIFKAVSTKLNRARRRAGAHRSIEGLEHFDKVIEVDQAPIGRTPRSNPATYTGLFDHIRTLYAKVPEARMRGYKAGRFSFNVKGGRCETCKGDGTIKIEMHFLPDVYVPCEVCHSKRYNSETLEVRYNGKSIADVLQMSVEEAVVFFGKIPTLKRRLQALSDVGLDYIRLGQPATTLSGGEAQRVKLATELAKVQTGRTLYILDEPTTGLHFADIEKLMEVILSLREKGNTVLVIEHNLDVIKCADYIVDMGPEGGSGGGEVLAVGTPEQVATVEASYTGQYLAKLVTPGGDEAPAPRVARPKPRAPRKQRAAAAAG
ncbi:MAG: uvrA [Thermoleophilia bacterium]|nr:uvrA [Thermoleophilia bacterium]